MCEVRLRVDFIGTKAHCFSKISHVTLRLDQIWETGSSNRSIGIQENDALSHALNYCRPGGKVRGQSVALNMEQSKSGLVFVIRSKANKVKEVTICPRDWNKSVSEPYSVYLNNRLDHKK